MNCQRILQCCLGKKRLREEVGTASSQLEIQRKPAITDIMRRNPIKAPGQVCEGGVIDMQDLEMSVWDTRRRANMHPTCCYLWYQALTEVVFTEPWLLLALFFSMPRIWFQPWRQQGSIFTRSRKIQPCPQFVSY